uniref:Beclin-1-like protein n=1 Tax=Auxenochlorella protothecoides TaxID=3075 RepID=A0A1D1ZT54_AUXPR
MEPTVFLCQQCKTRILISASDAEPPLPGPGEVPSALEESFMQLEDTLYGPRGESSPHPPARRMEESFVVLPSGTARGPPAPPAPRVPFHATLRALTNVLEAASAATGVDHPVCTDCAADVHRELDAQTADLQADLAALEVALGRLEGAPPDTPDPAAQDAELAAAGRAVEEGRARLGEAEAAAAAAEAEVAALEAAAADLSAAETAYWHEFNAHQGALAAHVAERDAVAARLQAGSAALGTLRRANVLNDAFRIWFSGPFGTIGGLRLGRTPACPVPWEEVNAAWGAAVALLSILARLAGAQLSAARLLPMGSYPRVADARGTHELYGPVSKLLCPSYDKAQVGFLACLKEYAEWLAARGASPGFSLPWAIEGDRVGSQSIRYMLAKDKNWTKALKYMLVDLKFCLKATVALDNGRAVGAAPPSAQREDPDWSRARG